MESTTLKPGLLVSLKTTLSGNVSYNSIELEEDHKCDDGARRAKWETERTIVLPGEYEESVKVRSKCRSMVSGACISSYFGLLCPEDRVENLKLAIRDARRLADEFNNRSQLSKIGVFVITGKIARDDEEAAKAIRTEVESLMKTVELGLENLDAKKVREAVGRLKPLGNMLSDSNKEKIEGVVEAARKAARAIVKAGEQAAIEVDRATINKIKESRTAFLDFEETETEIHAPAPTTGRALDLAPEEEEEDFEGLQETPPITRVKTSTRKLELD